MVSPQIAPSGRLSLSLEADITSKSDFLQSKKDMTIEAKSTLYKNNVIVSSASQVVLIRIEESNFLSLKLKSSKDRLDHIKAKIMEISLTAIDEATAPLECQILWERRSLKMGKYFLTLANMMDF